MDAYLAIASRRDARRYRPDPLPDDVVERILDAGRLSGSASNRIDQGGCSETSRPTTHSAPTYVEHGVVHYCVTNMPGSVARTSTFALNNVTLPFTLTLAGKGWRQAMRDDVHLRAGLNVHDGKVYCAPVAEAHGLATSPIEDALKN